jgi:aryl carrier-like protein
MQLINMCKYMTIPPYGSNSFLRFQLRHKIRTLKEDDQRILWEGIDSLTKMELREACRERGMRSTGLSKEAYKRALQQWLDLSVNKKVPIALLIMSRTFFLRDEIITATQEDDTRSVAGLADAISGLDKIVVNEVILGMATSEERKSSPDVRKIKLEVLEHQNERIREEELERESAVKKKEQQGKEKMETADLDDTSKMASKTDDSKAESKITTAGIPAPSHSPELKPAKESKSVVQEEDDEYDLSTQEMDAISQMLSADPVRKERAELERIKAAMKAGEVEVGSKAREEEKSTEDLRDAEKKPPEVVNEGKLHSEQAPLPPPTSEEVDKLAASIISGIDRAANLEAERSTSMQEKDVVHSESASTSDEAQATEEREDPVIARLKKRLQSMVGKIEVQLSKVQVKIGDKLHFLDKVS